MNQELVMPKKVVHMKGWFEEPKPQMIYSDRIFELDTLSKIRGKIISKCWNQFSNQEPFSNHNVVDYVPSLLKQSMQEFENKYVPTSTYG